MININNLECDIRLSKFNVVQKYNKGFLVYNTLSTSLVELDEKLFNNIFVQHNFTSKEIYDLYNIRFLVDDNCDENDCLKEIRQDVLDNSSDKIGNIIIAPTFRM